MTERNYPNRALYLMDNLEVLRGMNSGTVDLIATDPPFNKGVRAFEGITKAGKHVEYKDVWTWGDVQQEWLDEIRVDHPSLHKVVEAANSAAGDDMGAFLCWMAPRVLAMHRVLKDTGSLYLHCDSTAAAWIKAMLDSIFGRRNFRNEVIWHYGLGGFNVKRWFPKKHDVIFYYAKSKDSHHNKIRGKVSEYMEKKYSKQDDKGKYFIQKGRKYYLKGGKPIDTLWDNDNLIDVTLSQTAKERTGYPTQKPLALLRRIIEASSNPGDLVVDPFAGCATTCVAAEQLGRQWVGIDINVEAGSVIWNRLQNEVEGDVGVHTLTDAPIRTDDGKTAAPELVIKPKRKVDRGISAREAKQLLLERDGLRCQGCGWIPPHADYLQRDHKKPRSLGGSDTLDNSGLLCGPCNMAKGNKLTLHELRVKRVDQRRMDMEWFEEAKWR